MLIECTVTVTREDARRAGEVRALLASRGAPTGPYDVLIAGQAIARSMILITHNTNEIRRVPGLRVEDWQVSRQSGRTPPRGMHQMHVAAGA